MNGSVNANQQETQEELEPIEKIKCVIVGDGGSGKTSLLIVYTEGEFPEQYVPTVFENYSTEIEVDGKKAILMLWDTAGQEDYDRLRPLSYDNVDVVIMCYDVTTQASFENVSIRWLPEVNHFCPDAKVMVVACKTDLRPESINRDTSLDPVTPSPEIADTSRSGSLVYRSRIITTAEGENLAKSVKACAFIECSAKENKNVDNVFETAAHEALYEPPKNFLLDCCTIL